MEHVSFDLNDWKKVSFDEEINFTYNHQVLFHALNIDSTKFYFLLKEKFGFPNIPFDQVAKFFEEKARSTNNDWCYLFQSGTNYFLISGDDLINMSIYTIEEPPKQLDLDIFCSNINKTLEKLNLGLYDNLAYDIFINYRHILHKLIQEYKTVISKKSPLLPEILKVQKEDFTSTDPLVKYKIIEYSRDYNQWLKATIDKATISLQIQILLPIYFESLVDLAFRNKLQKKYYDHSINYDDGHSKKNIFEYFEGLNLQKKIEEISLKCFGINKTKMALFLKNSSNYKIRKKRNKLIHGNSLLLKNLNIKYYLDETFLIGIPDRHSAERVISESIANTLLNGELMDMIKHYENLCNQFIEIFDDDGYFRNLSQSIIFGHNQKSGGMISIGFDNLEDLYLPEY